MLHCKDNVAAALIRHNMWMIVLILAMPAAVFPKEQYQNSSELCTKQCSCSSLSDNMTLTLNCANKGFQYVISNWPGKSQKLKATFSYNNMSTLGTLPGSDAEIELVFDHCQIKYLNTGLFESCRNVVYIDLSYNSISSDQLSPDVFKGPADNNSQYRPISLKHLNLAYNQIHSLNKNIFEHVPDLEVLNLEGNHFRVLDFVTQQALLSATKLQKLNLANNALTELVKNAIVNHTNMREIDLSKNEFDFVPYTLGYVAGSLEKLKIDGNPIIELIDTTFQGFSRLIELSANNLTKLHVVRASAFKPLANMRVLKLSDNEMLTDIDREAFGAKSHLTEVYLNNNALNTLDFNLLKWSQLEVLEMHDNSFMCNCDLYNITTMLSDDIKRNMDGPWCIHPRKLSSQSVYELTSEICLLQPLFDSKRQQQMYGNVNILRLALVTTSVILIVIVAIASLLMYAKFKGYRRSRDYPYPSQVVYTSLAT